MAVLLASAGCFSTDEAPDPPVDRLYFPTGLVASPGGRALYVVSSDFDLQYRAGNVLALDLDRIRALVPRPPPAPELAPGQAPPPASALAVDCAKAGLGVNSGAEALLQPGPCTPIDLVAPPDGKGSLVKAAVNIGAFAADVKLVRRPEEAGSTRGARLLIPVRGDPSLTWVTIDDDGPDANGVEGPQRFGLACGQSGDENRCAAANRAGTDATDNVRELVMPAEPFQLAIGARGDTLLVTHQTSGAVSLFQHGWPGPGGGGSGECGSLPSRPRLSFVLGGLPTGASGIAALPQPRAARLYPGEFPYTPAFLVSFRSAAEIDVIRYYDDCAAAPSRPFLSVTARSGVSTAAGGFDSRGIAIDARSRQACEEACDAADKTCLVDCATVPVDVFVANRTPPSLLVGSATGSISQYGTDDQVTFRDLVPLAEGASRVAVGQIVDRAGQLRPRVFVTCFDARLLYVYDPDARAIEAIVKTGRGPSAIEFDPRASTAAGAPNYAYLAHFTDSYIGVIDLDMRNPSTYLTLVATVGVPQAPRDSQ